MEPPGEEEAEAAEEEREYLSAQVTRLFWLLGAERLSPDEARELGYWRSRASPQEWDELQAAAQVHASQSQPPIAPSRSPALAERLRHQSRPEDSSRPSPPAQREPGAELWQAILSLATPAHTGSPADRAAYARRWSGADELDAALEAARAEHAQLQRELEREHGRALAQLEVRHAREMAQAQSDEKELRAELERSRAECRDELSLLRGRAAHAELSLSIRDRELAHARGQAESLRAEQLEHRLAGVRLGLANAYPPPSPFAAEGAYGLPGIAPSAQQSTAAAAALGAGAPERLAALRSEIDLLIGMQGGRVQTAESEIGSLLKVQARLTHSALGTNGPRADSRGAGLRPLTSFVGIISDGARARTLASGCLAIRAQVRQLRMGWAQDAAGLQDALRETEGQWNQFVAQFSRMWEATVLGTNALAADAGAARERVHRLDEHSQRLDEALRARAAVPTRVLAVATLPFPGEAVRCSLDIRGQSIEVADGPEKRVFRFDRVAALEAGASSLPALSRELGEAVDSVAVGGCATLVIDGPRGCGKSWLLDGSEHAEGGDGLLGGAVRGLLAALCALESAQPPQVCALWLSAVDVHGDGVVDLVSGNQLHTRFPLGSTGAPGASSRWEGAQGQGAATLPRLAAIPTYETFLQVANRLLARPGAAAEPDARARAARQWLGPFSLKPTRAHCIVTLHLERSTANARLGTASLTLVELASASSGPAPLLSPLPTTVGSAGAHLATVAKSVAAMHGVLIALATGSAVVPYRHSRLTLQLQQPLSASGLVLLVLPVQCASLTPTDDACRTLAVGAQLKAVELCALKSGAAPPRGAPPPVALDAGTPQSSAYLGSSVYGGGGSVYGGGGGGGGARSPRQSSAPASPLTSRANGRAALASASQAQSTHRHGLSLLSSHAQLRGGRAQAPAHSLSRSVGSLRLHP
mmetsp:Transcript_12180/g.28413  ORF Transcript_12180/g.28413 Transcript_12180/m.28413 type:complete len:932 (+) Transcript_12180:131-2926(+)